MCIPQQPRTSVKRYLKYDDDEREVSDKRQKLGDVLEELAKGE